MELASIHIQCVYGDDDVTHIEQLLLPSLLEATRLEVDFHCLNFNGQAALENIDNNPRLRIHQVASAQRAAGFAENHNTLFKSYTADGVFMIVNPDCIAGEDSVEKLLEAFNSRQDVAIVEARQWPFEHSKGYDAKSLETKWACGAFALIDSAFYASIGGMDENYFLYAEDTDLSYQATRLGMKVLYQPEAEVMHFTGSRHYPKNFTSLEWFFGIRNSMYLARKFGGAKAEKAALKKVRFRVESWLADWAIASYKSMPDIRFSESENPS